MEVASGIDISSLVLGFREPFLRNLNEITCYFISQAHLKKPNHHLVSVVAHSSRLVSFALHPTSVLQAIRPMKI